MARRRKKSRTRGALTGGAIGAGYAVGRGAVKGARQGARSAKAWNKVGVKTSKAGQVAIGSGLRALSPRTLKRAGKLGVAGAVAGAVIGRKRKTKKRRKR